MMSSIRSRVRRLERQAPIQRKLPAATLVDLILVAEGQARRESFDWTGLQPLIDAGVAEHAAEGGDLLP